VRAHAAADALLLVEAGGEGVLAAPGLEHRAHLEGAHRAGARALRAARAAPGRDTRDRAEPARDDRAHRRLSAELGLDAAIDHRAGDLSGSIREVCPKGVDVYFDNVGGEALDAALANLAMHGRVVLCGAISRYGDASPAPGPRNYLSLLFRRGRMEGFIVSDYLHRAGEALPQLATWLAEGKLVAQVDVVEGLENAPAALRRLYVGENRGKQLVRIAPDPA
jgi:NADPH-dependent curcumin reductase CurA